MGGDAVAGGASTVKGLHQNVLTEANLQLALNLDRLDMLQDESTMEELAAALHSHIINVSLSESP